MVGDTLLDDQQLSQCARFQNDTLAEPGWDSTSVSLCAILFWRLVASAHVGGRRHNGTPVVVSRQEHPAWPRCFFYTSDHPERFNFALWI